jgi:tRNA modification GTPase
MSRAMKDKNCFKISPGENIQAAKEAIEHGESPEIASFELREALDNLDEITGKKINDEVLDKIFSSFCVGK